MGYGIQLNKQTGIGLLELMLSMVIIAILTLMSIQYFGSSKMNTQTTKGVDEIQDIISIVSGFPNPTNIQKNSGDDNNLNNAIIMSGQLPETYIYDSTTIITPWTDSTKSSPAYVVTVDGTILTIVTKNQDLPNWACQSLVDKFHAESTSGGCDFKGKSATLTLKFELDVNEGL